MSRKAPLVLLVVIAIIFMGTVVWVVTMEPPLAVKLEGPPPPQDERPLLWWTEPTRSGQGEYSIVRLDLYSPEYRVDMIVNPPPKTAPESANARLELPITMAKVGNFLVAVNTTPYTLPESTPEETESWKSFIPGIPVTLRGFAKPRNQSNIGPGPAAPSYPIFWVDGEGQAGFSITSAPDGAVLALSAYHWLLRHGKIGHSLEQYTDLNYRSAIGLSGDGRWLFLIVCGPSATGKGKGVALTEMANRLLNLGITDAMNLDGGSSTSLVIRQPNGYLLTPSPKKILSRPIPVMLGVTPK